MSLIIVSGRSGSGKSTALQALEDLAYHCIDNLPVTMLPALVEQVDTIANKRLAVCIDARNTKKSLEQFADIIDDLEAQGTQLKVIFLDAEKETLHQRYNATRRKHPLAQDQLTLEEAINLEVQVLEDIRERASLVIDTTDLPLQELRSIVRDHVDDNDESSIILRFQSFGFKHGAPTDADFVFDVRCLPNPYWDPNLRVYTGLDKPIQQFLSAEASVSAYLNDIRSMLDRWLPSFEENHRSYVSVAIGCTGGQHRSVYMTEQLGAIYAASFEHVQIRHREISRKKHG